MYYPCIFPERLKKTKRNISLDHLCPGGESNCRAPKSKPEALLLDPTQLFQDRLVTYVHYIELMISPDEGAPPFLFMRFEF
jgi:hypothetical protein